MPRAERETVRVSRVRKKQVIWPVHKRVKGDVMFVEGWQSYYCHDFLLVKMRADCLEREISYYIGQYQLYNRD